MNRSTALPPNSHPMNSSSLYPDVPQKATNKRAGVLTNLYSGTFERLCVEFPNISQGRMM
jgi:hypothetical protein